MTCTVNIVVTWYFQYGVKWQFMSLCNHMIAVDFPLKVIRHIIFLQMEYKTNNARAHWSESHVFDASIREDPCWQGNKTNPPLPTEEGLRSGIRWEIEEYLLIRYSTVVHFRPFTSVNICIQPCPSWIISNLSLSFQLSIT